MHGSKVDSPAVNENRRAALDYAAMGWPVIPGAIWHDGRFADPADEGPVTSPCLRPVEEATTDAAVVWEWWSAPGLHQPNAFTATGSGLGAFMVAEPLVIALANNPWFTARPTPVLAFPNMPIAYFLVRPPVPGVLLSDRCGWWMRGCPCRYRRAPSKPRRRSGWSPPTRRAGS